MILHQQKIFIDLDKHLLEIYRDRELKCLSEIKKNEKRLSSLFHKITDKKLRINEFNSVDYIFDIEFISGDIKYFTGLLYLLRPFINLPSEENGTYFQNIYDHRYMVFVNVAHQCVYNFWDRIGDLLYYFFQTGLSEKKVYLSNVLNNFPENYKNNIHFNTLNDLYESDVKSLLNIRHQIVHNRQLESKQYLELFKNRDDEKVKSELEKEKKGYPDYFKKHLDLSNIAFEHTLKLIDLLPNKKDDS